MDRTENRKKITSNSFFKHIYWVKWNKWWKIWNRTLEHKFQRYGDIIKLRWYYDIYQFIVKRCLGTRDKRMDLVSFCGKDDHCCCQGEEWSAAWWWKGTCSINKEFEMCTRLCSIFPTSRFSHTRIIVDKVESWIGKHQEKSSKETKSYPKLRKKLLHQSAWRNTSNINYQMIFVLEL